MNRIILRIRLIKPFGVVLQLVHLDPRFMSNSELEFLNFYTEDHSFLIYSRSKMTASINSLRLPDKKNYKPNQKLEHHFNEEKDRYEFLKNLRTCLVEWSNKYEKFVNDFDYKQRNQKLIMEKEYWII